MRKRGTTLENHPEADLDAARIRPIRKSLTCIALPNSRGRRQHPTTGRVRFCENTRIRNAIENIEYLEVEHTPNPFRKRQIPAEPGIYAIDPVNVEIGIWQERNAGAAAQPVPRS